MLANGAAELVSATIGKSDPASIVRVPCQVVIAAALRNGLRSHREHGENSQQQETEVAKVGR
jgi:hypothetical protein